MPLTGGLRISFSPKPDQSSPDVHAGDEVSIAPDEAPATAKNDDSLILQLVFGSQRILLPGDAEK